MDLKAVLFNTRTLALAVVLTVLPSIIPNLGFGIWWTGADMGVNYGFPFSFYGYGGGLVAGPQVVPDSYFNAAAVVADFIVWYLVASLKMLIWSKVKA